MGRHQARKFFDYNPVDNLSHCKVEGCSDSIKGNHGGNLLRHIQRRHSTVYAEVCQGTSSTDTRSTASKRTADSQTTLDSLVIKQPYTISVKLAPDVLKEACLELLTVNGRPFSLMEDSGFKKIICPIVEAMGNSVAINQSNIREMVIETARIERERTLRTARRQATDVKR